MKENRNKTVSDLYSFKKEDWPWFLSCPLHQTIRCRKRPLHWPLLSVESTVVDTWEDRPAASQCQRKTDDPSIPTLYRFHRTIITLPSLTLWPNIHQSCWQFPCWDRAKQSRIRWRRTKTRAWQGISLSKWVADCHAASKSHSSGPPITWFKRLWNL